MPGERWRIVILSMVLPATLGLDGIARSLGHTPVALITPRPREGDERRRELHGALIDGAPSDLDVVSVPASDRIARLLRAYEPDVALCVGFPWLLRREVLEIPRLGIVNGHPSLLPRHRGPAPLGWAVRDGDAELGLTFHLMDEQFDTGPILAQGAAPMPDDPTLETIQPVLAQLSLELLPRALGRLAAGDRGDAQPEDGASYARPFGPDELWLDQSRTAREVRNQVASWRFAFSHDGERGPLVDLDGVTVRVVRASLTDPGGARRIECADAPVWILESEEVVPA